ncbi:hypothetical protein BGZ94_009742 [Podila epigama]|nr:hypothetical protein BGZ94_009742 [Podila epigama]
MSTTQTPRSATMSSIPPSQPTTTTSNSSQGAMQHHLQNFITASASSPAPHSSTLSHAHSLPNTPTPLFQLINFPSRLVLENVYLNGLHSLRRFGIKNTSPTDIIVKMRSSLAHQISFQLTNENLPFDPDSSAPLQSISTNTAAAAEAGSLTASGHEFNQLFNHVNLIDEVFVAAGETEHVILGFLPDPRAKSRRGKWDSTSVTTDLTNANAGNGSTQGEGAQMYDDGRQRDLSANGLSAIEGDEFEADDQVTNNFDSFEVNGLVFFFAYKVTSAGVRIVGSDKSTNRQPDHSASPISEQIPAGSTPSSHAADLVTTSSNTTDSVPHLHHVASESALLESPLSSKDGPGSGSGSGSGSGTDTGPGSGISTGAGLGPGTTSSTPHKADYQHTVKFRSTVCRSVLYSNIGETGINFEDCVANQQYVKDFTIWNRSEIPLYWQLHTTDVGNQAREDWLKFVDYEDSFGDDVEEGVDYVDEQGHVHLSKTMKTQPIPSYGYRRIRVIFFPRENGDFLFDMLLENLNDATNMEEATIHAAVRAVSRGQDTLLISSGTNLDFGDCCAGSWTRLPMTFTNTGTTPTEIHLKVEGADVVFDIQVEPGAVLPDADQLPLREEKFSRDTDNNTSSWYESSRRSDSSMNTDQPTDLSPSGPPARSRLRDWMDDGPQSPGALGYGSSSLPSTSDSTLAKDRLFRDSGAVAGDSGPSSPVTSEGFFPDNLSQINSNVEKYLTGQELGRAGKEGTEEDLESEADSNSLVDSTNTGPNISHKKRPSLRSISFSGAQREKELAQAQLHGPQSPVRGNQSSTRIEELFIKPGKERTVIVSYRPVRDSSIEDFQAGKLLRKSFRIIVSYAPWGGLASSTPFSENPLRDRKIIQCKARACTSFVSIEPKSLDFGDTDVGHYKSLPIKLINQSEIPAIVQLDFQSKVLNCTPTGAITIPPKASTELKVEIYPRKVNPDYRKQLTLFNLTNRANDQIIEVRSTNIDKNRVTFHSLFYRVLYPGGSNFLDFGTVFVGGLSLRMITISNFTKKWLTLEVTTSLNGELAIYERAREHQNYFNLGKASGQLEQSPMDPQALVRNMTIQSESSKAASRGSSPLLGDNGSDQMEYFKPSHLSRRQDQRDQLSTTTSETGTPIVIGGSSLTSSLALKAKAILFHGEPSQTIGSAPAKFLDLATNKPRENKKVMRRIPTMKELLEPKALKTTPMGVSGATIVDHGIKRSDTVNSTSLRQNDQRSLHGENSSATVTDAPPEAESFLSARPLDAVLAALDANSLAGGSMLFYKPADEERFVKDKMKLARELQSAIASSELAPVSVVSVPPETEHQLFVLFTPSSTFRDHIKGIPKKQDARIFLRLVDFDHETVANNPQFRALLDGDLNQIPLREIMVRSSLVRSIMDLGQNNINFGTLDKGEKRTKTIVIQNRSKEPLLYHIRKSGSIASGDIVLGVGKSGVVRGYSKKEVDFIFEPSLSGLYHEKLAIENIQDPESSRILSVKANIRKPKHFSIDIQEVDFGHCFVGKKSECRRIAVTNSTKQTRTFEVRVDPHEMMPLSLESRFGGEIDFVMEDDPAGKAVVTKEMEDEIEILEQKLKIAKRKGRADKVLKVTARLSVLRKGGVEEPEEDAVKQDADDATPTQEKVLEFSKSEQIASPVNDSSGKGTANSTPLSTPVTTPTIKDLPKFKRTAHSIVFTLEAGKTKSVSAYFTPLLDQVSSGVDVPPVAEKALVQGKIYVHEHKNRDICRDVMFYAIVEDAPLQTPLTAETNVEAAITNEVSAESQAGKTPKGKQSEKASVNINGSKDDSALSTKAPDAGPDVPAEHLVLSPTDFDAGKIEQGQKNNFYFKLSNTSKDDTLPYRIDFEPDGPGIARFTMEESVRQNELEPQETRRINFGVDAQELGRLKGTMRVINLVTNNTMEFKFTCFSHRPQYLTFPSLDESVELDLGHCYVDTGRKYSQVTPLLVENITDDDIYIACASNLSQQVAIFMDEQAQKGLVTRTFLKKRSMVTVWVAVQPNLLGGGISGGNSSRRAVGGNSAGMSGSSAKDRDSECRTLVGGIKFTVSIAEDNAADPALNKTDATGEVALTQLTTQTVKFTSIIGRSILSVSDTLLNLGWTPDVGRPVYGSFTLQNMSSRLPLDFHVESLSGNIILDRTGGILDGWDVEAPLTSSKANRESTELDVADSEQMDRSRSWISFRVTASSPGLFTDTILVTNENNCSQKIEIKVRLFVDQMQLSTTKTGPGFSCPQTLEDLTEIQDGKPNAPREGLVLPSLSWKDVYLNVQEEEDVESETTRQIVSFQPVLGENEPRVEDRWIELSNDGDEVMELVPLCDIEVDAAWESGQGDAPTLLNDKDIPPLDGFHSCGPVVQLLPGAKRQLLLSCPIPDLPEDDIQQLLAGKSVTFAGYVMLLNRVKNQIVKVFVVSSTFGISFGEVIPLSTDVGKIGHYNSWTPARFKFDVKNTSDIPLYYEIVLEDYMDMVGAHAESDVAETLTPRTKRTIQSHETDNVELSLDPKRIKNYEIGRRMFPIRIVNLYNPGNESVFEVQATLTEFELGFGRLTEGKLVLPPLTHPLPPTALPCDTWFSITNKSTEDVRFEIEATLSPDVVDYVHLDVLSRFSNSPLRGNISLSPRSSIEVRIRAFPKEGSRLPSDTSALCTPEGLIFGNLWVTTKAIATEDEPSTGKRFAEDIPIRGTLVEGSMFSLSTQRVVFKSLLETSDYEDASDDERVSIPDTSQYLQTRDLSEDGNDTNVQTAVITISNLSTSFPLDFQVTLEGPMEYPAAELVKVTPLDNNNCGSIEAGQQLKLIVELLDPRVIISEDIKLYIRNLNSKLGQQQRVLISIVSDNREPRKHNKKQALEDERIDPHHHQNKLEEPSVANTNGVSGVSRSLMNSDESSDLLPIITLRGCKRIDSGDSAGGRFELDLGQQDMGSSNVLRKLVLENSGYERVSYRIRTISALDKNWIKISRLDGTLDPPSDEENMSSGSSSVNTISLSFATNVRNVFSTYLLIENMDNPSDTKTVRITMEVVARQNLRRATGKSNDPNNRVFDVFVNGIDYKNSASIDMKNLYYGSEYTARSMVVYNRETVPMEFTFKSNLSPSDTTELLFSTSRTSAKLFKTLTVPPENHVRVYIRFFPRPSAAIQAALNQGEYRDPDEMELKIVEIYINCRLVKDYQHVVMLNAECYLPALRVDWQDSVSFVARLHRAAPNSSENEEWKISFQEDFRILGVSNLLNIPLDYEIVNDTMYFNLEFPEPDRVIDGKQEHLIRVVPNVKALLKNAENFRKEKYVQENITIYNKNRPLENYWIPLRLSFGNVSNFQLSSGYKSSYAFGMIEQHVVNFLSDFNSHAVLVNMASCFSGTGLAAGSGIVGAGIGTGYGSGFASLGLGPERALTMGNGMTGFGTNTSAQMASSPPLSQTLATPVAGMLGLGRTTPVYHSPSHHPHYQTVEAQETQRKLIDLEFQYHYVVDQLVYYSTIKTGENFFQLASLLFCTLLGNRIFQIWSPAYLRDPRAPANGSTTTSAATATTTSTAPGTGSGSGSGSGSNSGSTSGTGAGSGTGSNSKPGAPLVDEKAQSELRRKIMEIQRDPNIDFAAKAGLIQTGANGFTMLHQFHPGGEDGDRIRVWPESLRKWVEALDYFVSFFPYHTRQLETLKTLHHSLISS